jgi:hypothetical protein
MAYLKRSFTAFFALVALALLAWTQLFNDAGARRSRRGGSALVAAGRGGGGGPAWPCTLPPKRLAIYQGRWWHTEVFGFLLDFARRCGHSITVYHSENHATSALPLWRALFAPLSVRPTAAFRGEHGAYDAIFLTTPDDDLDEYFRKEHAARTIYAAHMTHPKFLHRWHVLRMHMTPLAGYPFVLQAHAAQEAVPAAARERAIVMVGTVFDGKNYEVAAIYRFAEAVGAAGWKFVAFSRHWDSGVPKPANVEMVEGAGTEDMYDRVRAASYVLIFPSDNSWYVTDRITGALPLAVGAGTPIITTARFADIYGLSPATGAVVGTGAEGLAAAVLAVKPPAYAALVTSMSAYRARVGVNNVGVIEMLLRGIPGLAAGAEAGAEGGSAAAEVGPGGGAAMLPLPAKFATRTPPDIGCRD